MADTSAHRYLDAVANQLMEYTRERAGTSNAMPFEGAVQQYATKPDKDTALQLAALEGATLTPEQKLQASRAMAAERIVLNALGNMYRRMETPDPQERFKQYFEQALVGKKPEEQDAFVDVLKQAQEKMIISVVQTMHPTIYHTEFARDQETALTQSLEKIANGYRSRLPEDRDAYRGRADYPLAEAKRVIDHLVDAVMSGTQVTPVKQVTVVQENRLDRENHVKMQDAFDAVVRGYNAALSDVSKTLQLDGVLTTKQGEKMRAATITDKKAVWRTWAYGADADGRDLSTSIVLFDGIHHHLQDGEFIGRKRDLRENAKDQKQSISCLVQRACRKDGNFWDFCAYFDQEHQANVPNRLGWVDSRKSTVLQLTEQEQAEVFRTLLTEEYGPFKDKLKGMKLVPDSLKDQTIAFNEMFREEYRRFLKERGEKGDGPLPDLRSLNEKDLQEVAHRVSRGVECGPNRELVHFTLDVGDNGHTAEPGKERKKEEGSLLYSPKTGDNQDFFKPAYKPVVVESGTGSKRIATVKISDKERRKTLDVVKRLQVLDHAIDKFGQKVADRYQIANFENASDFYATMLLFKETGIIKVENGVVVGKPKLSLQPLLETEQDQKNAIGLFTKLLDDPLVLSYYKALGNRAEMMLGYSDGAKSAGNLASEWSIYKCGRDLKQVFADKGIELTFLHGRGRGDSRGGQYDEGQNYRAAAYQLHEGMYYDQTHQADGPMNDAISSARGESTLTSIVTGILTAKREAEMEKQRRTDPSYAKRVEGLEKAIDAIAADSSRTYLDMVATPPDIGKLLGAVHDNPFKSSRAASRKEGAVDFESARAITVEYGLNAADAPLLYVGMKKALENFVESGQQVQAKDGRMVSGQQALEALYEGHPAFRNMLDKTELGMRDYDPAVFRQYAKVAGVSEWAEKCIKELDGLAELTHSVRVFDATKKAMKELDRSDPARPKPIAGTLPLREVVARTRRQQDYEQRSINPIWLMSLDLDKRAHALALSGAIKDGAVQTAQEGANPFKPQDPIVAEALLNVTFVTSAQHSQKGQFLPPAITAAVDNVPFMERMRKDGGSQAATR
jgi:phosphoenolpyruvate carboxylase